MEWYKWEREDLVRNLEMNKNVKDAKNISRTISNKVHEHFQAYIAEHLWPVDCRTWEYVENTIQRAMSCISGMNIDYLSEELDRYLE